MASIVEAYSSIARRPLKMLWQIHVLISSLGLVSLLSLGCGGAGGAGDTSGASSSGGGGGSAAAPKRVFVTEGAYSGDLVSAVGGAADGLAAGDALCGAVAQSSGLGGSSRAWLSSDTVSAVDRLEDVGPWYDVTEAKVVFRNKAAIPAYPAAPGIVYTEKSSMLVSNTHVVWTGTNSAGHGIQGENCDGWSSAMEGSGRTGVAGSSSVSWTDVGAVGALGCFDSASLYCFEQ